MHLVLRSTLALSVLVHGAALAQKTPPYAVGAQKPRSCSTSSFTLEVPLWAPSLPTSFNAAFASAFSGDARWFGLTSGYIQPVLTPVLPEYSGTNVPAARRDGHRRAFVVSFQRLSGYPPTWSGTPPVREEYACAVVSAVRAAAAQAQALTITDGVTWQAPLLVSRSCDTVVQDAEANASPSLLSWARTRVSPVAAAGLPQVDVALIDTGVDPAFRSGLGVVSETALPSFERVRRPEYHPHGAQMAALIRSVAPNARIRSYRALDGRGMGSLQSVARAVDDALFDPAITYGTRKPLVVNLSVGAPPELSAPAYLTGFRPDGSVCKSWEDGAGETLRYVLYVAGQFELLQQQGVFVSASGGNSPLELATTSGFPVGTGGAATPPCPGLNAALSSKASFFPAAFGETPSCRGTWATAWLPVLPVGASTFDDRRSSVTRIQTEPRVYAPGERVFAVNALFPSAGTGLACGTSDVGFAHALESPGAVTGTSAAAALTSGAAAHLIGAQYWGPVLNGWRAADMARLLYLTGQPLCSPDGLPGVGRRVSISRATQAITSCTALRTCLRSSAHPVGPMVNGSTASVCASAMTSCFGSAASLACPAPATVPGWEGYGEAFVPGSTCALSWKAAPGPRVPAPRALFPDQQLSGLGPQPSQSGCPNCLLVGTWDGFDATLSVRFELNDALPPETRLEDAYVVFLDEEKNPVEWVSVSDGRTWLPGEAGDLKVGAADPAWALEYLRAGRWTAVFDIAATGPEGEPARLISPLVFELR
jgi:hypothetical protein